MARIMITPETLREQAGRLGGMKAEHENLSGQIQNLVVEVAQAWEGAASAAFVQSFETYKPQFQKFASEIDSFRQRMLTAAQEMEAAEQSVKAKMSQL